MLARKEMGMKFEKCLTCMEKFTGSFSRHLEWIGVTGLIIMFLSNFIDVVGAKIFKWPLPGATEVISFAQIVAISSSIAYTLILGRHIRVEFIIEKCPKRTQAVINSISSFFSLTLFILILWQSYTYGQSLQKAGEIGSTSYIPFYPFAYFIAFCSIPVCLVFLIEIIKFLTEVLKNGSS